MLKNKRHPILSAINLLLIIVFIFSAIQFGWLVFKFVGGILQIDFSIYYTAAQSLNAGLSPYINNINNKPPIWDGVDVFQHSIFLYPPLAANLFQPLTLLPYRFAKLFWTGGSFLLVVLCLIIVLKSFAPPGLSQLLIIGIAVALYFPLQIELERGQIDAVILFLLICSEFLLLKKDIKKQFLSGILLSISTLLKLHCVYMLPFLVFRKRWNVIIGYALGGLALIASGLFLPGGRAMTLDYVDNVLPRVSKYGFNGTLEMMIDPRIIQKVRRNVPVEYTIKDGRVYLPSYFKNFEANATGVRPILDYLQNRGWDINQTLVSLLVFAFILALIFLWYKLFLNKIEINDGNEFIWWQVVFCVILLSSPLTWAMNVVWLLPSVVIVVLRYSDLTNRNQILSIWIVVLGLLLVAVPDTGNYLPFIKIIFTNKYIAGELLVLLGWLLFLAYENSFTLRIKE